MVYGREFVECYAKWGDGENPLAFQRKIPRMTRGPVRLQNGEYDGRKNENLETLFLRADYWTIPESETLGAGRSRLASCRKTYTRNVLVRTPPPKKKRPKVPEMVRRGEEEDNSKRSDDAMDRDRRRNLEEACKYGLNGL